MPITGSSGSYSRLYAAITPHGKAWVQTTMLGRIRSIRPCTLRAVNSPAQSRKPPATVARSARS